MAETYRGERRSERESILREGGWTSGGSGIYFRPLLRTLSEDKEPWIEDAESAWEGVGPKKPGKGEGRK